MLSVIRGTKFLIDPCLHRFETVWLHTPNHGAGTTSPCPIRGVTKPKLFLNQGRRDYGGAHRRRLLRDVNSRTREGTGNREHGWIYIK